MKLYGYILLVLFGTYAASASAEYLLGDTEMSVGVKSGQPEVVIPIRYNAQPSPLNPQVSVVSNSMVQTATFGAGFALSGIYTIQRCYSDIEYGGKRSPKNKLDDTFCVDGQRLVKTGKGYVKRISDNLFYKKIGTGSNTPDPEGWEVTISGVTYTYYKMNSSLYGDNSSRWVLKTAKRVDIANSDNQITNYEYRANSHDIQLARIVTPELTLNFIYERAPYDYIENSGYTEESPQRLTGITFEYNQNYSGVVKEYKFSYEDTKLGMGYRLTQVQECFNKNSEASCYKPIIIQYPETETPEDTAYTSQVIYEQANSSAVDLPVLTSYVTGDIDNDGVVDFCTYSFAVQNIVCGSTAADFTARGDTDTVSKLDVSYIKDSWKSEVPDGGNASTTTAARKLSSYVDALKWANSLRLIDINGDGYLDYCFSIHACAVNDGAGFFKKENPVYSGTKEFANTRDSIDLGNGSFVDLNGDSLTDFCKAAPRKTENNEVFRGDIRLYCAINLGKSTGSALQLEDMVEVTQLDKNAKYRESREEGNPGYYDKFPVKILRLNDDLYYDFCYQSDNAYVCKLGDNSANFVDENKQLTLYTLPSGYESDEQYLKLINSARIADINRDGNADICFTNDDSMQCRGVVGQDKVIDISLPGYVNFVLPARSQLSAPAKNLFDASLTLTDVNRDSYVDACFYDGGNLNCAFGYVGGLRSPEKLVEMQVSVDATKELRKFSKTVSKYLITKERTRYTKLIDTSRLAFGPISFQSDMLGSGRSSVCYRSRRGLECFDIPENNNEHVKTVISSFGISHQFSYSSSLNSDVYNRSQGSDQDTFSIRPFGKLVNAYKAGTSLASPVVNRQYVYDSFRVTKHYSPIGFSSIVTKDLLAGTTTVGRYSGAYDTRGFLVGSEQFISDDSSGEKTILEESRTPVRLDVSGNAITQVKANTSYYIRLKQSKKMYRDSLDYKSEQYSADAFSSYGQVKTDTRSLVDSTGADKSIVKTSYYYDVIENKGFYFLPSKQIRQYDSGNPEYNVVQGVKNEYDQFGRLIMTLRSAANGDNVSTDYYKRLETHYSDFDIYNQPRVIEQKGNNRYEGSSSQSQLESRINRKEYYSSGLLRSETNAEGHKVEYQYDNVDGSRCLMPTTVVDVNGRSSSVRYDAACRVTSKTDPYGITTTISRVWDDSLDRGLESGLRLDSEDPSVWSLSERQSKSGLNVKGSIKYFNAYGSVLRQANMGEHVDSCGSNAHLIQDYAYDVFGNTTGETALYYGCANGSVVQSNQVWVHHKYDNQNRLVKSRRPTEVGEFTSTFEYLDNMVSEYQNNRLVKKIRIGIHGKPIEISSNKTSDSRTFVYDGAGNVRVTANGNKETKIEYDDMGNKLSLSDPDTGRWTYNYNSFGEQTNIVSPTGTKTDVYFDRIGRKVNETYKGGSDSVSWSWTYDPANAIGSLSLTKSNDSLVKQYKYNTNGLISSVEQVTDGQSYVTGYKYDQWLRPDRVEYASGLTVFKEYDYLDRVVRLYVPESDISGYNADVIDQAYELLSSAELKLQNELDLVQKKAEKLSTEALTLKLHAEKLNQDAAAANSVKKVLSIRTSKARCDALNGSYKNGSSHSTGTCRYETTVSTNAVEYYQGLYRNAEMRASAERKKMVDINQRLQTLRSRGMDHFVAIAKDSGATISLYHKWSYTRQEKNGAKNGKYKDSGAAELVDTGTTAGKAALAASGVKGEQCRTYFKRVVNLRKVGYKKKSECVPGINPVAYYSVLSTSYTNAYNAAVTYQSNTQTTLNNKIAQVRGLLDQASEAKQKALAAYQEWKNHSLTMQAKSDTLASLLEAKSRIGEIQKALDSDSGQYASLWAATRYTASGSVQSEVFANGYTTNRTYYPESQRLQQVTTAFGSSKTIRNLKYGYDLDGLVVSKDGLHLGTQESFEYNDPADFNRLTHWSWSQSGNASLPAIERDYRYDTDGNIETPDAGTLTYPGDSNRTNQFVHRADGSVSQLGSTSIEWTSFNQPKTLTTVTIDGGPISSLSLHPKAISTAKAEATIGGGLVSSLPPPRLSRPIPPPHPPKPIAKARTKTTFEYEPGGSRIRQTTSEESIVYINDDLKKVVAGSDVRWVHSLRVNGSVVAVIEKSGSEADRVAFIHRDLVGNADTITDIHGNVLRLTNNGKQTAAYPLYAPYGELLGYVSQTNMPLESASTTASASSYRASFERQSQLGEEAADLLGQIQFDIQNNKDVTLDSSTVTGAGMQSFETEYKKLNSTVNKQYSNIGINKVEPASNPFADSAAITSSYLKVEFTSEDKAEFQGQLLDELPGFTGHEKLKGHNLIHMNGRIYSPAYGRFISADIGVPYPDDWYSYNRYMYVGGNPAGRFDPSGFTDRDVHPQQFERMPWESQQGQIQQQADLQIPANFSLQQYMDVSLSSMNAYSPQLGAVVNLMQYQAVNAQLGYYSSTQKINEPNVLGFIKEEGVNVILRTGQSVGGAGQVLLGGAICYGSGGLACAAGALIAAKGVDNFQAGIRGADSVSQQLLVYTTGSETAGTLINAGLDLGSSVIGLVRSVPKISEFGTPYNASWYKGSSEYFESSYRQATMTTLMIESATSTTTIIDVAN